PLTDIAGEPVVAGAIAEAIESIEGGPLSSLTGPSSRVTALALNGHHRVLLINSDLALPRPVPLPLQPPQQALAPGEVRVVTQPAHPPIITLLPESAMRELAKAPRVIVENV